jgi:hypothetical protein
MTCSDKLEQLRSNRSIFSAKTTDECFEAQNGMVAGPLWKALMILLVGGMRLGNDIARPES